MVYVMVEKSATNNIRVYEVWKTNHYSATFKAKSFQNMILEFEVNSS